MPSEEKTERNKRIVRLRLKNPERWTFEALAKEFNITRITAYQVYDRFKDKYTPVDKVLTKPIDKS